MKKGISFVLAFLFLLLIETAAGHAAPYRRSASDVYVSGYTRSDGTHVRSHYRSAPDATTTNNYGSWDYQNNSGDNHTRAYGW